MKQKKNNKHGFTLVEIIVVLVILAILAAILIPSMVGYIKKANEKKDLTEARNVLQAVQTYADEHYDTIGENNNISGIKNSAKEGTAAREIADLAEMPDGWAATLLIDPDTKTVWIMRIVTPDNIIKYGGGKAYAEGGYPKGWTVTAR